MRRCLSILYVAACLALVAGTAHAQQYPIKLIRIVVPFTPGGAPDLIARSLAPHLQERLGQTVIVENKPGAGGNIGAEMVARSPADGYAILLTTAGLTSAPWVNKNLPFDVIKDFSPIGGLGSLPMVLAVVPDLPVRSTAELIAYAKANPGKLLYASSGPGTLHHLTTEMFKEMTGTDIVHVPYKGAVGMLNDMLAGQVHMMFGALNSALPHIQSGKLRALALAEKTRNPILNVPTVNETVPGFEATAWFGTAVPAGTPAAIVKRLSDEQHAILALPDVRSRLEKVGFVITPSTPEEMRARMVSETEIWRRVTKAARIMPE